ncbi:hypothetical protein BGZ96_001834 [Linnemannia gamsii]|uniref:Uncharacterized protein n=1 Tax=Linnemannia gamsii TaxID=64522 RepID=A0ABQ7K9L2_9FUNG|nr:hypothetical protein BGZ96_001834 [Linnemannia gamsii]
MDTTKEHQQGQPQTSIQDSAESKYAPGIPSEMSSMVSLLASSVNGMQGSLGNAYQSMANQVKQSMEMTQTMSKMMEMFLVSSLSISSRIEHDDSTDNPILILVTENKSQFPIPGLSGSLRIGNDDNKDKKFKCSTTSLATVISKTYTMINRGRQAEPQEMKHCIYQQPRATSEGSQPSLDVLLPGMRCIEVFELSLERFDEWVILVEARFNSPGSGEVLSKRHECCIYLIDQCSIKWLPADGRKVPVPESSQDSKMMTGPLRQILKSDKEIQGRVSRISEDSQETSVSLWSEQSDAADLIILERIAMELGILGEHPAFS